MLDDKVLTEAEVNIVLYQAYCDDIESGKLNDDELEYAKLRRRQLRSELAKFLKIPYRFVEEAAGHWQERGLL